MTVSLKFLFFNLKFMSTESLIGYLSTITNVSPNLQRDLERVHTVENYRPHQIFHAAGQIENRLWYLQSGFARSYYFDQTGKEHTLNFYQERDLIFSYKGLWKESSDYYLEAVEDTTLISITYQALNELLANYPETKTLTQVFTRHRYNEDLFKSRLMTWHADERYKQFRKTHSNIFKRASVRLIASYLNMSRENLSRLISKDL
jgi:CRP-like cAMP-binding protein